MASMMALKESIVALVPPNDLLFAKANKRSIFREISSCQPDIGLVRKPCPNIRRDTFLKYAFAQSELFVLLSL
jgi:hypothetical protein